MSSFEAALRQDLLEREARCILEGKPFYGSAFEQSMLLEFKERELKRDRERKD